MDLQIDLLAIASPFVFSALTAYVAKRKGRTVIGWLALGFVLQVVALVVVARPVHPT